MRKREIARYAAIVEFGVLGSWTLIFLTILVFSDYPELGVSKLRSERPENETLLVRHVSLHLITAADLRSRTEDITTKLGWEIKDDHFWLDFSKALSRKFREEFVHILERIFRKRNNPLSSNAVGIPFSITNVTDKILKLRVIKDLIIRLLDEAPSFEFLDELNHKASKDMRLDLIKGLKISFDRRFALTPSLTNTRLNSRVLNVLNHLGSNWNLTKNNFWKNFNRNWTRHTREEFTFILEDIFNSRHKALVKTVEPTFINQDNLIKSDQMELLKFFIENLLQREWSSNELLGELNNHSGENTRIEIIKGLRNEYLRRQKPRGKPELVDFSETRNVVKLKIKFRKELAHFWITTILGYPEKSSRYDEIATFLIMMCILIMFNIVLYFGVVENKARLCLLWLPVHSSTTILMSIHGFTLASKGAPFIDIVVVILIYVMYRGVILFLVLDFFLLKPKKPVDTLAVEILQQVNIPVTREVQAVKMSLPTFVYDETNVVGSISTTALNEVAAKVSSPRLRLFGHRAGSDEEMKEDKGKRNSKKLQTKDDNRKSVLSALFKRKGNQKKMIKTTESKLIDQPESEANLEIEQESLTSYQEPESSTDPKTKQRSKRPKNTAIAGPEVGAGAKLKRSKSSKPKKK